MRQTNAAVVIRRRKDALIAGLRKPSNKIKAIRTTAKPRAGGINPVDPNMTPAAEVACVAKAKVVVTVLAPGVTLVGEKDDVHLLGSPEQLNATEESYGPPSGLTSIV